MNMYCFPHAKAVLQSQMGLIALERQAGADGIAPLIVHLMQHVAPAQLGALDDELFFLTALPGADLQTNSCTTGVAAHGHAQVDLLSSTQLYP